MFGKRKKTVSLAHKERLLAEIAHYEKRIEEALNRRKQNSFADGSIEENVTNPYKLKIQPSQNELKQQEASLCERVSMTLELAMLTVMQSEVNVMVTPPEVRKPVPEDGVWYEVEAECKIDLVSFAISFYAHKPRRKFAPTRYRNLTVKPAHEKELAQSILPELHLPNLALQVLQSYATAFRSRRTTLLELAEKFADKLRMRDLPEGGYRVTFLDLLQVDWMLENLWSPVVPFCHRMKFEVEYMPKEYIQAIGKLYKQFKDPNLNTSGRTLTLSKIFEICLQAAGPARELQESFESDSETTGRLHERRTTIDQEPDVPQVEQSPKKKNPTGKENKPQDRKTSMAPPKTIPKKAKKSKRNEKDINETRKSVKRAIESDSSNVIKKSKVDDNDNSKKAGLKGGNNGIDKDNETGDVAAKNGTGKDSTARKDTGKDGTAKTGTGKDSSTRKDTGKDSTAKTGTGKDSTAKKDTGIDGTAKNGTGKNTTAIKDTGKDGTAKNGTGKDAANNIEAGGVRVERKAKETYSADAGIPENVTEKRDGKTVKSKGSGYTEDGDINNAKKNKEVGSSKISEASSKGSKKGDAKTNDKIVKSKEKTENIVAISKGVENMAKNAKTSDKNNFKTLHANTESNVAKSKKVADKVVDIQNDKPTGKNTDKSKNTNKEKAPKKDTESTVNKKEAKKVASAKNDEGSVASSKKGTKKGEDKVAVPKSKATKKVDGKNVDNTQDCNTEDKTNAEKVNGTDTVSRTSTKTVASKDGDGKIKAALKNLKDTNKVDTLSKKVAKNTENEQNAGNEKTKCDVKKPTKKDGNTAKQKEQGTSDVSNKNSNDILKENKEKTVKQTNQVVQKSKVFNEKPTDTNKETAKDDMSKEKGLAEKRKFTNPKSNEQTSDLDGNKITVEKTSKTNMVRDAHRTDKNEVLAKKIKTAEPLTKNIKNNNENPKTSTTNNKDKPNNTKPLKTKRILKENTNHDETDNNVEKNITKNQKSNMLNVTITKSKIIPLSKLQPDTQMKIADKLKTKIPMMKSKMTFSSLGNKLKMNNLGRISKGVEKTKIPQKNLPVFKKVTKNIPTRISPRKLPTAKPSSHGFSNK